MANKAQTVLRNLNIHTAYELKYPIIQPDGNVIKELDIRRPKGKDFREFEDKNFPNEAGVAISRFWIQKLTSLVPEDIDELDGADLIALNKTLEALISEGK